MKRIFYHERCTPSVLTSLHLQTMENVHWDKITLEKDLRNIEGILIINPGVTKGNDIQSIEKRLKDNPNAQIYITLTPKFPDNKLKQRLESEYKNVTVLNMTYENSKEIHDYLRKIILEGVK